MLIGQICVIALVPVFLILVFISVGLSYLGFGRNTTSDTKDQLCALTAVLFMLMTIAVGIRFAMSFIDQGSENPVYMSYKNAEKYAYYLEEEARYQKIINDPLFKDTVRAKYTQELEIVRRNISYYETYMSVEDFDFYYEYFFRGDINEIQACGN